MFCSFCQVWCVWVKWGRWQSWVLRWWMLTTWCPRMAKVLLVPLWKWTLIIRERPQSCLKWKVGVWCGQPREFIKLVYRHLCVPQIDKKEYFGEGEDPWKQYCKSRWGVGANFSLGEEEFWSLVKGDVELKIYWFEEEENKKGGGGGDGSGGGETLPNEAKGKEEKPEKFKT